MTQSISNQSHWQAVLRQQKLANARRWLALIASQDDPAPLVTRDYDNFLRALEATLQSPETFDLAYRLIQSIYFTALDYADWDRWLIYLEKAREMSQELKRETEMATLLVQEGDIHRRQANLEQAENLYQIASEKYQKLQNSRGYASTLARIALLRGLQGDVDKGIALCQQVLAIAETINDDWVIAQANLNLSKIYVRSRDLKTGLVTAERAYSFYKKQDDPKFAAKALLNIVAIWAALGEWEKVDQAASELIHTLTAAGDIRTLSQLKNNLGSAAFNQAKYAIAEAAWQEALGLHSQIQEPAELATLYNNLGMVYTKMGEWAEAEAMLQKAIAAHEQLGDTYNWANSLDNLADLYEVRGETAVYQQTLQKAYAGLQPLSESPHAQELLVAIRQRLDAFSPS